MVDPLPEYSRTQLALRNGQDRKEVWIAFNGIIYDVTPSRFWLKGMHFEHWAGQDLTHELPDAPHDDIVFEKLKAVGKIKNEDR